ncbi:MAG: hypothetical protein JWQ32_1197 [Marmoricola sp.]|nr:hypothetical protein [Marmoricola sp.]
MSATSDSGTRDKAVSALTIAPAATRRPTRIPTFMQVNRVPLVWFELLLIVAFDLAYERVRNLVRQEPVVAINHGLEVHRVSQWFHVDLELAFNKILMDHHWLATLADYDYSMLHLPLTAGVLVWVFWKHRDRYLPIRNVLLGTTLLGLVGFWIYPMAPPRLLPGQGFVDTVVYYKTWGSWGDPKVAHATNQFAAMPSLHCAWALWCGLCLFFLARNRAVRTFGALYPVWTVFVVIGTANHFLLDSLAGLACVAITSGLVWKIYGRHPWVLHEPPTTS